MGKHGNPVAAAVGRLGAAVRNGLEIARFGGLGEAEGSPYDVVARRRNYRLRRYFGAAPARSPAIVLVPPLMLTAEVYDVSPEASAVRILAGSGIDPWVVDFGAPEREEGGLSRTLTDHVVAVSEAVDRAREAAGRDVHLAGYSQGGMFCYQTAAYRRSAGLASLVTFGSPVDMHRGLPPAIPDEIGIRLMAGLGAVLGPAFAKGFVPAWLSRVGFRLLDPVKDVQQRIDFLLNLYDRERLLRREAQRRFLATEGWVAYPGPALHDFLDQMLVHNRMLSGGLVIGDRSVSLADVTCPILTFVGETDEIARPPAVRAIRHAAPLAEVYEVTLRAGHFGLVVGTKSSRVSWPTVAAWLGWREGLGPRPENVVGPEPPPTPPGRSLGDEAEDLRYGAGLAVDLGRSALRAVSRAVRAQAAAAGRMAATAMPQLSRLSRLDRLRRDTRIGMGLLLDEQAASNPEDTFFLFEGRAYPYADANRRVDAVVRGLVSVGVHQGEPVGVLMRTRPSALAAITALNRLGAIAVCLRPDGPLEDEIALSAIHHLVADPEHAARAHEAFGREIFVLGGGGLPRDLPAGQIDLEPIEPERVTLPAWYEPNPGRSEDVALVLFSGRGESLRCLRITNRRWAISAFGTASAAALDSADTVYCCTPVHHPTGILVCVGCALAGGARLAVASRFDAGTFWEEVRRYGANVVFYTGAMLAELVDAPPNPAERHHPVRLFAGSGMPRGVWGRLLERFGPAGVLEFYASTEGNAVLANLSGEKVGALGRPLPGSSEIAIAAFDFERREIRRGEDGLAVRADENEAGLLLARVERERGALEGRPLRGVFERGDAWVSTGDLFRRDEDGDYWLVDHLPDLIDTRDGPVSSLEIEDALGLVPGVGLAVAYGVCLRGGEPEIPVAALRVRPGEEPAREDLARAVARLAPESRPAVIRLVETLPMTAGWRPIKGPLRAEGIDPARLAGRALVADPESGGWRDLDAASLAKLSRPRRSPAPRRRGKAAARRPEA